MYHQTIFYEKNHIFFQSHSDLFMINKTVINVKQIFIMSGGK